MQIPNPFKTTKHALPSMTWQWLAKASYSWKWLPIKDRKYNLKTVTVA